jgi:hypothetical protein
MKNLQVSEIFLVLVNSEIHVQGPLMQVQCPNLVTQKRVRASNEELPPSIFVLFSQETL